MQSRPTGWRSVWQNGTTLGDSGWPCLPISTCGLCYFARFRAESSEYIPFHLPTKRELGWRDPRHP